MTTRNPAGTPYVRLWLLLLWICFVLRGGFYACALPLWEGFDEYAHYASVAYLAVEGHEPGRNTPVPSDVAETLHHIPSQNGGMRFDEFWKLTPQERQGGFPAPEAVAYEAQQPPLFYWLFAALYRATGGLSLISHVIVLRLACVLLASLCVPLGFLIAQRVFDNPAPALGATALIAAMPVLTFTATHIANDAMAIALGAAVVLFTIERRALALAMVLGAALLTKAYALAFLPPIALLLLYRTSRRTAAIALGGAAAIAGWWYARTWIATGSLTGNTLLIGPDLSEIARQVLRIDWLRTIDMAWVTFVWTGNWSFLAVRSWMYRGTALLGLLALAGLVKLLWKRNAPIAVLCAFLFSFALAVGYFGIAGFIPTGCSGAAGWYACCLVSAISVALCAGLRSVAPGPLRLAAGPALVFAFSTVELFGAHIYLFPYYTGFISHLPNGGLPAFRFAQLGNGGFWTLFERLGLYKPAWLTPALLIALWLLFLLATLTLIVASIRFAAAEATADRK